MKRASFPRVSFVVNGARVSLRVHPLKRLLDVLREDCGLTATKEGCGEGECGACTVVVDGVAVNSCLVPVQHVAGRKVLTVEGLKGRHPLQQAFARHGGAQCGICTPGMIMAAVALGPSPTLEEVRAGLAGNICRCTGYEGIYRSVEQGLGARGWGLGKTAGSGDRGSGIGDRDNASRTGNQKSRPAPRPTPHVPRPTPHAPRPTPHVPRPSNGRRRT